MWDSEIPSQGRMEAAEDIQRHHDGWGGCREAMKGENRMIRHDCIGMDGIGWCNVVRWTHGHPMMNIQLMHDGCEHYKGMGKENVVDLGIISNVVHC